MVCTPLSIHRGQKLFFGPLSYDCMWYLFMLHVFVSLKYIYWSELQPPQSTTVYTSARGRREWFSCAINIPGFASASTTLLFYLFIYLLFPCAGPSIGSSSTTLSSSLSTRKSVFHHLNYSFLKVSHVLENTSVAARDGGIMWNIKHFMIQHFCAVF